MPSVALYLEGVGVSVGVDRTHPASLDSTNGALSEPITDGHASFRCEPASLIACTEDPGEIRQLANDRRLDELAVNF